MNEQSSVQVTVRVRPSNSREVNSSSCVTIRDNTDVLLSNLTEKSHDKKKKLFKFDYAMDADVSQRKIFETIGEQVINNAYTGYNCCVFAYGQTGSGKSFTMMGTMLNEGLIPRICKELFTRQVQKENQIIKYRVEVSYVEIYSEKVRDLISKQENLKVRQHPELGPYIENVTQLVVEDYASIRKILERGDKERHTASTQMNNKSSRSHAICTIQFTQIIDEPDMRKCREIVSRINLVDLAGSEKVEASGVTGINFQEAVNINQSLSTLGLVISKLSCRSPAQLRYKSPARPVIDKKKGKKPHVDHIPFRDSVLTWILKDSLGGNSKTFMIATVSPATINYEETLNTLRYANNAKKIVNTVRINEDPNEKIISLLKDEIQHLRRQMVLVGGDPQDVKVLKEEIKQREELLKVKDRTWEQKLQDSHDMYQVQLFEKDEVIAKMKSEQEEQARLTEEKARIEREQLAEQTKLIEEKARIEREQLAEQARIAEEKARIEREHIEEQARIAEAQTKLEKAKLEEQLWLKSQKLEEMLIQSNLTEKLEELQCENAKLVREVNELKITIKELEHKNLIDVKETQYKYENTIKQLETRLEEYQKDNHLLVQIEELQVKIKEQEQTIKKKTLAFAQERSQLSKQIQELQRK